MCTKGKGKRVSTHGTCITRLAQHWNTEGVGYKRAEGTIFYGPFTLEEMEDADIWLCDRCLSEVLQAGRIVLWKDARGLDQSTTDG